MLRQLRARLMRSKCCGVQCYYNLRFRCSRCDKVQVYKLPKREGMPR